MNIKNIPFPEPSELEDLTAAVMFYTLGLEMSLEEFREELKHIPESKEAFREVIKSLEERAGAVQAIVDFANKKLDGIPE